MAKEIWINGKLQALKCPAMIRKCLGLSYREWWRDGRLHRDDHAALKWKYADEWWQDGKRHCLKGPAIRNKYSDPVPKPTSPFPFYPDNHKMSLPKFYEEICRVSEWLDTTCYDSGGYFNSHGDFGAKPAVMLSDFGLNDELICELQNTRSVTIVNRDEISLDKYFDGENDDGDNLFDLLGKYDPVDNRIYLFMPAIVDCANRLDDELKCIRGGSPCAMTLFYTVFLHELGHALYHFYKPDVSLGTIFEPRWYAEMLAQHFTKTCIEEYGMRANDVFLTLENHQPRMYSAWRNEEPYKWGNCQRLFSRPQPYFNEPPPKLKKSLVRYICDKTYYIEGVAFEKKEYDKDSRVLTEKKINKPEDKQISNDLLNI